jgi:serine/threonine protein kinase
MNDCNQIIGTTIDGKYRIDRLIDKGGMGAIYAATHLNLNRTVAVKLIRTDFLSHPTSLARFKREARMAARVEHPHAVTVYDFGSLEGVGAYLAMEFVKGESLRSLLARQGSLPLAQVVEIASQVASVLGAAHRHGIVHRDVKPANILLRSSEGRLVVKITDFGIAKSVQAEETTQLTSPSELVGTPSYMSPEQFSGEPIDGRADLYALGVVVYEMISGRCPFEGTLSEVIGKHLFAEPPALPDEDDADPFSVFIQRALAKSPEDRPSTALEFLTELTEAATRRAEVTGEPMVLDDRTLEIEAPVLETERVPLELVPDNSYATAANDDANVLAVIGAEATSPLPTVFVPEEPKTQRVALSEAETTVIRPRVAMGRRTTAMAAGVALTALLVAGANAVNSDGTAAAEGLPRAVGQITAVSAVTTAERPAPSAARNVETTRADTSRSRRSASRVSKPRKSGNRFVRVLRVDRHLARVFRG